MTITQIDSKKIKRKEPPRANKDEIPHIFERKPLDDEGVAIITNGFIL